MCWQPVRSSDTSCVRQPIQSSSVSVTFDRWYVWLDLLALYRAVYRSKARCVTWKWALSMSPAMSGLPVSTSVRRRTPPSLASVLSTAFLSRSVADIVRAVLTSLKMTNWWYDLSNHLKSKASNTRLRTMAPQRLQTRGITRARVRWSVELTSAKIFPSTSAGRRSARSARREKSTFFFWMVAWRCLPSRPTNSRHNSTSYQQSRRSCLKHTAAALGAQCQLPSESSILPAGCTRRTLSQHAMNLVHPAKVAAVYHLQLTRQHGIDSTSRTWLR